MAEVPVTSSTTVTMANLIIRIQVALNDEDETTWTTPMLATFLNEAIRDYSQHFPRVIRSGVNEVLADVNYDNAPPLMYGVISVEYPVSDAGVSEDPPVFLKKRPYTHPDFFTTDGYYDVIHRNDDDNARPSQIVLSGTATANTYYRLEYYGSHDLIPTVTAVTGNCTVVPHHQHLLIKHVMWQATNHLLSAEQQSPTSNSSLLMAQYAQNARRFELAYNTALQQAIYAAEGPSRIQNWTSSEPSMERVY